MLISCLVSSKFRISALFLPSVSRSLFFLRHAWVQHTTPQWRLQTWSDQLDYTKAKLEDEGVELLKPTKHKGPVWGHQLPSKLTNMVREMEINQAQRLSYAKCFLKITIAIHDLCATSSLNSIVPHGQLDDSMAFQGHTTQANKKQVRQG